MSEHISDGATQTRWSVSLLAIWKRRRWLGLASFFIPLAAASSLAAFLPARYRSAALVEVARDAQPGEAQSLAIETQLQRLNEENLSRSRLERLIEKLDLYPEFRRKTSMEAAVDQMRRDIQIELKDADHVWSRESVAFQIAFRGAAPSQVAQVTNALASFYGDRSEEQRARRAQDALGLLQAQADEAKERLAAQGQAVSAYIALHLQELPDQVRVNMANLDRLNTELSANRSSHRRAGAGLAAAPLPAQDAAQLSSTDLQLARLNEQLTELRGKATDQYPDVVRLKQQIAQLTALSSRRGDDPEGARSPRAERARTPEQEREALEQERAALDQTINATEQKIYNAPKREQELRALLAPYESTRVSYEAELARLEDARAAETAARASAVRAFRILDPATPALAPSAPDRLRVFAVGLVLALLFALLAIFLAEKFDTSFHSLDELRAFTRVPVLASVPNIVGPRDLAILRRRAGFLALLVLAASGASAAGTYAYVHHNEPLLWMLTRGKV